MNAEQYLERIENKRLNSSPLYSREEMIAFAEKYAKQLRIGGVVQCMATYLALNFNRRTNRKTKKKKSDGETKNIFSRWL